MHIHTCAETRKNAERVFESGHIADERNRIQLELHMLQTEITQYAAKSMRIYDDFCEGVISESDYRIIKGHYEAEHMAHLARIDELEAILPRLLPKYLTENPSIIEFEKFANSEELTRDMLTSLVNRINIDSDFSIDIQYRFAEEYEALRALIRGTGEQEDKVSACMN